jgi:tetratricopeptide (TPR) repeat protein
VEVLAALQRACRAQLLEDAGSAGYRFVHDVVREVVEAGLGSAQQATLHRRIAEALEELGGELPPELLAYHYARSAAIDKAALYLERAGDHARTQRAHAAAAGHYQDLVELLERTGRALEAAAAREKWAAVLATMARYDAALAVLDRAADTYGAAGDEESLGRVTAQAGDAYAWKGTPGEGVARVQALTVQLEAHGPSPGLARLYTALARLLEISGRYDQMLAAAERAVTLAHEAQDDQILGRAESRVAEALCGLGRREEARLVLEAATAHAEAVGDLASLSYALDFVGNTYEAQGEYAQSRAYAEQALVVAERLGDPVLVAAMRSRRGMSAYFTGDWAGARADFESSLALDREVGPSWVTPYLLLNLGRLCWAEGAWEEAARLLDESCGLSTARENLDALRWVQGILAERDVVTGRAEDARARLIRLLERPGLELASNEILLVSTLAWTYLELGDLGRADAHIELALGRARAASDGRTLPDLLRVLALVRVQQGRWAEATAALEEGLTLAWNTPYPYAEGRLLHDFGVLHLKRGQTEQARQRLEAALAIFRRLGARKHIERAEQLLTTSA